MKVLSSVLFPAREKRSPAVSLFQFRLSHEIPTGAARLNDRYRSKQRRSFARYAKMSVCNLSVYLMKIEDSKIAGIRVVPR